MIRRSIVLLAAASLWFAASCSDASTGTGTPDPIVEDPGEADVALVVEPDGALVVEPDAALVEGPDAALVEDPVVLSILSVDPDKGTASGLDQVEIVATGLTPDVVCFFNESVAQDTFILDDTRMVVVTPPRIPGLVDVILLDTNTGAKATLEAGYLFFNPTTIVSVDPPTGHVMGGEPITLTGTGFLHGTNVLVGGRAAIGVEVVDDSTILAITPDAPGPGTVDVHVSNDLGVGTLTKGFTYFESPMVHSVVPAVGTVEGGLTVEVHGAGFVQPLLVNFGTKPLEDVTIINAGTLQGTTPAADQAGPIDVVVSTGYGSSMAADAFTYLGDLDPGTDVVILAVTPPVGPSSGGNLVTIVAKGLTEAADTTITFGGVPAVIKGVDGAAHVVLVEAPSGEEGSVDVILSNSHGEDLREAGYTYQPFVKVYEVLPNFGPLDGGTAITVDGDGFVPGLQVRVGALPATDVEVVDEHTITVTTPPGSPGLANVTVLQGDVKDTLVGGFAYQAEMNLWVVDPGQGSQAGGTFIELAGSGFPVDATVLVGGFPATHVIVAAPTKITCRTPPGYIGTVDVTVVSNQKGTITLPQSFTYYDPESMFGGTWGNEVDGTVNVTVLSTADGSGIPDAFVMLWTDPTTPYQGYTNSQGQITFSGPDLLGEQMVSASKDGYASTSVIEYNATNVTLYMTPTAMGSGVPPPGVPPPLFKGQVLNAAKYVPVPWGDCASKTTAPGTLCDTCTTDAECGGGGLSCNELPDEVSYCTSHCTNNDDCPGGFMCYPLNGVPEPQCVPSSGVVTAFCNFTKYTIFSREGPGYRNYMEMPGMEVNDDFSFEFYVPLGEFAVFCYGGIMNPDTGSFTPYGVGLARHVFALPGEVIEEQIILNHPLNSEMNIRLDDPPNNPTGPNFNYLFTYLDLGSDGVFEFLDHPYSFSSPELVMPRVPKVLSGDLYDASYSLLAVAFSYSDGVDNLPISVSLHHNITKTEDDTFYRHEAAGWQPESTGVTQNINALWAPSADDYIGVGTDGLIIRSVGSSWASQASGTDQHLRAVHALTSTSAVAVGNGGVAVHYDGLTWSAEPTGSTNNLEGVWMAAPDDVYAVGWYTVMHYDGLSWSKMSGNTSKNLRAVFGFAPDDVWAVGNYGQVIHYDGSTWTNVTTGSTQNLRAVWGVAPDDLFIVGEGGSIFHWDGEALSPMPVDTTETFEALWGTGPDDVVAVGSKGRIFRYDGILWIDESPPGYDATFLAVAGAEGTMLATGTHELLLGPFLEVPENMSPADGGTMGADYDISWTVQDGVDPHFSYIILEVPGMMGPVPEWTMVADYNVTDIVLPDFPNIDGTPGIAPGTKYLTLIRGYKEGFDIDNYSNQDFNQLRWQAWALDNVTFTKL